ncbi:MAG: hypothetical protein ACOC1K_05470 [Nanoarchaeota archaeon]
MILPFIRYRTVVQKHVDEKVLSQLGRLWTDHQRKYHSLSHLEDMLSYIEDKKINLNSSLEYEALIVAAFFHDSIYDIKDPSGHEDKSKEFFKQHYTGGNVNFKNKVLDLIETTKYRIEPNESLEKIFWKADNNIFNKSFVDFVKYETLIRQEYKSVPLKIYKEKRKEFLEGNKGLFSKSADKNIDKLISWIDIKY